MSGRALVSGNGVDLRHGLISAALGLVSATRAHRWLGPVARGRGVILTFHRVLPATDAAYRPNASLEVTPAFLGAVLRVLHEEGFETIPIGAVPDRLADPKPGPPFAVLTFDDGYRDNIRHAWPVLKRHGAPWTVYVANDLASGAGRLWWVELERAIARLDRIVVDEGRGEIVLPTTNVREKAAAFLRVANLVRRGDDPARLDVVGRLTLAAGIDFEGIAGALCADWEELRDLAADPLVTVGSHTLSHPCLARMGDADAEREVVSSRSVCSSRMDAPVDHFSYPYGDPVSAGEREFELAVSAGYRTAVTTRPGHLTQAHAKTITALPRISVNGNHQNEGALRALLSGIPFLPMQLMAAGQVATQGPRGGNRP